jgi:hypothetical protein
LINDAWKRKMKKVDEYVEYLTIILDNLEKSIVKLNHRDQR